MNKFDVRELRKRQGYTREVFSDLIGISIHTLDSWEGGRRKIPESKIKLMQMMFSADKDDEAEGRPAFRDSMPGGLNGLDTEPSFMIDFDPANQGSINWYEAQGDSMNPEIKKGDYIAFKEIKDFSFLPPGCIYAITTNNDMRIIRRLHKGQTNKYYVMTADNPDKNKFPDIEVPKDVIVKVCRADWVIKKI